MSDIETALVALIRRVVREEMGQLGEAAAAIERGLAPLEAAVKDEMDGGICGARDPQRPQAVCMKPRHRGRHKFTVQAAPPPPRNWESVKTAEVKQGSRTYTITTEHHPVKVFGLGRGGGAGDGWEVVGLERNTETGEINAEVIRPGRNQRSRVVKLDRIVYKRPKKKG